MLSFDNFDYLLELTRVSGDFVYCLVQDRMFTIKHDSDSNSRMQMFSTRLIFDETVSNANTWTGKECFKWIVASKESLKGILIAEKSLKRILVSEKLPEHFISTAEFEVKIVSTGSVISSRCRVATIISGTLVSCKNKQFTNYKQNLSESYRPKSITYIIYTIKLYLFTIIIMNCCLH